MNKGIHFGSVGPRAREDDATKVSTEECDEVMIDGAQQREMSNECSKMPKLRLDKKKKSFRFSEFLHANGGGD